MLFRENGEIRFAAEKRPFLKDEKELPTLHPQQQGLVYPLNTLSCSSFILCTISIQYLSYWLSMFSLKCTGIYLSACCPLNAGWFRWQCQRTQGRAWGWPRGIALLPKEGLII